GGLTVNLDNYIVLSGDFGYEKSDKNFKLSNGEDLIDGKALVFSMDNTEIFAGVNYGKSNEAGISLTDVSVGFALISGVYDNNVRQWTTIQASAASASLKGVKCVTLKSQDILVKYNSAVAGVAIDYANSVSSITYGDEQFTMDSEFVQVTGSIEISIHDFFSLSGTLEVVKESKEVTLSDGSKTQVDMMAITGYDLNAFAGINGGKSNQSGFILDDANFSYAIFSEQGGDLRTWDALKANVNQVGFVGVDGISITGNDIEIEINQGALDQQGVETVIDFQSMQDTASAITFSHTDFNGQLTEIKMDMAGNAGAYIELSGTLNLSLFDFYKSSDFYSLRLTLKTLKLSDGSEISATMMTFARDHLNAKAGIGDVGFAIDDLSFGFSIISDGLHTWASLKATANQASFEGLDGITADINHLEVIINTGAFTFGVDGLQYDSSLAIDYSATSVQLSDAITLDGDIDQELYRIKANLDFNIYNFVSLSGDFAFDKTSKSITLQENQEIKTVDMLTVSAIDVNAFAGLALGSNRLGFELEDMDFALAIMQDKENQENTWTSIKASAAFGGFIGGDGLVIQATDIALNLNQHKGLVEAIDFTKTELNVSGIVFDFNEGNTSRIEGNMDINIFGLYKTTDYYSFDKNFQSVIFDDGSIGNVDILTLGGHIDSVFAGVNEGSKNEIGFKMTDAGFGLAFAIDTSDPSNFWVTAQASAAEIAMVGLDDLASKAEGIELVVNTKSNNGRVIDYSKKNLEVTYGASVSGQASSDQVAYVLDA
ncbi:hypothetical protein MJH12_15425, partial [bacterium]|nr:hypothetical protein [bacterium]